MEFWSLLVQGLRLSWGLPDPWLAQRRPRGRSWMYPHRARYFYSFIYSFTHSFIRYGQDRLLTAGRLSHDLVS